MLTEALRDIYPLDDQQRRLLDEYSHWLERTILDTVRHNPGAIRYTGALCGLYLHFGPFAGYVSGHSTFSRAGAEVLTAITGDPYFPGGLGEFSTAKDEFLVFEDGPSRDMTLQWATYRDAADQTSLSRIWGGIHPPFDDIPGRRIGILVAADAFQLAERYFAGTAPPPPAGSISTIWT